MRWILLGVAFLIGTLVPLQPGVNNELRAHTGSAFFASFISFLGGVLIVAAITLASRPGMGVFTGLGKAPWWAWMGGALGATFVTTSIILAPKLGAALLLGGIVSGQMISSLVIDHYGLVGYRTTQVTPVRVVGVLLVIAGVILIQRGTPKVGTPGLRAPVPAANLESGVSGPDPASP